jgi:hypothetical protein
LQDHRMYLGQWCKGQWTLMMYTDTNTDTCTHTSHGYFRCMARICMFRCMFRIECLDECLGFTLRKNYFPNKPEQYHSNHFLNKPWDQIPLYFPFIFLIKPQWKLIILDFFFKITNQTSQFHESHAFKASQSPFFKISIFKLKINQQK